MLTSWIGAFCADASAGITAVAKTATALTMWIMAVAERVRDRADESRGLGFAACAPDHVVHGLEVGDRNLPGCRAALADSEAQRRPEHAADHPRHGPERSHRHADQRDFRLAIGL